MYDLCTYNTQNTLDFFQKACVFNTQRLPVAEIPATGNTTLSLSNLDFGVTLMFLRISSAIIGRK